MQKSSHILFLQFKSSTSSPKGIGSESQIAECQRNLQTKSNIDPRGRIAYLWTAIDAKAPSKLDISATENSPQN